MLNIAPDIIPLPSDPRELTQALALQCCTHPEVMAREFALIRRARLVRQHTQSPTEAAPGREKAAGNAR